MTATEFNAVNDNITVSVPVFSVKPGQTKGDAKKALPSDLFVGSLGYEPEDDEDELLEFHRLNSQGHIETNESGNFLAAWSFKLDQLNYVGEAKISLRQHNELTY